jgi:hypothetical protein
LSAAAVVVVEMGVWLKAQALQTTNCCSLVLEVVV